LIPRGLMADLPRRANDDLLNLKDLLATFPASVGPPFPGLDEQPRRGKVYLVIPQGLLAGALRRAGKRVLHLKDLLTVIPPTHGGQSEKRVPFEASFLCRIAPNPTISCQNVAEYGRNRGFSLPIFTHFVETC